jgi:hypothetical protein
MLRSSSALRGIGAAIVVASISVGAFAQPKPLTPAPGPKAPAPAPAPTPAPLPAPAGDVPLGLQPPAGEPSAADLAKARAIFDAGGRAYDSGNYAAALQAFEQAYTIAGRDNIVFSIAQAHRQAFVMTQDPEHLAKAITAYKQFIASGKAGARKGEAVKALGEVQAIQATRAPMAVQTSQPQPSQEKTHLAVDSPTPGVMISIDGSEPAPPQVDRDVAVGPHQVKLTAPGYVDKDVTVRIDAGEYKPVTFELEEKPAKLGMTTSDGAEISVDGRFVGKAPLSAVDIRPGKRFVSVTLPGHQSKGEVVALEHGEEKKLAFNLPTTAQRNASYVVFGFAAAGAVATAILGGVAIVEQNNAQNISNMSSISRSQQSDYADDIVLRNHLRTSAAAVGAGTAAAALLGVVLFVFDRPGPVEAPADMSPTTPKDNHPKPSAPKMEMRLGPWFSPDAGGVGVGGRF